MADGATLAAQLRNYCRHNAVVPWSLVRKAAAELERLQSANNMLNEMADAAEKWYWATNRATLDTTGSQERMFDALRLLGRYPPPDKNVVIPGEPSPIMLPRLTPEQQAYFADLKARHMDYDPNMVIGGPAMTTEQNPPASQPGDDLVTTYHVVAYDESYGGYGDNASRDFKDEADAIAYARNLRLKLHPGGPRYEPIRVFKKMTTEPITVEIPFDLPPSPPTNAGED